MPKVKKQTFIQGIITLMFSQIFVKIFGLIYKLYLTNKDGFGDTGNAIYSSGFQIYALLLTISSIGVPNAIAKLASEKLSVGDERNANRIFKIAFAIFSTIGFIGSVVLFLNAKYIATNILEIPEAELTLQALAPSVFFVSIISVFRGYFNAKSNMKPTANSQSLEQLLKTIFTIGIVEYIYTYIGIKNKTAIMAAGANLATTISAIFGFIYLLKYYIKNDHIIKRSNIYQRERTIKIIRDIFIVSMPITISAILGTINKNIDSFTVVRGLKHFLSVDMAKAQYGILSGKVDTLVTFPMSLNIALTTSLVPAISAAKATKHWKNAEHKIKFSILATILIGLPCTVGMIIFANPILKLLFPNASEGTVILQVSSLSIIFILINQTVNGILQGLGKQFTPVISLLIGVIVKLIANLILVPINPENFILGGTVGAATGTLLCYIIELIINIYILKRNINIKFNKIKFLIKPIICTGIMAFSSLFVFKLASQNMPRTPATLISITFAIVIYAVSIFTIKIFDKDEVSSYIKENVRKKEGF